MRRCTWWRWVRMHMVTPCTGAFLVEVRQRQASTSRGSRQRLSDCGRRVGEDDSVRGVRSGRGVSVSVRGVCTNLAIDQSWASLHHCSCNFVAGPVKEDCGCPMPSLWYIISHLSPSPAVFPLSTGSMYFSKSPSRIPSLSLH